MRLVLATTVLALAALGASDDVDGAFMEINSLLAKFNPGLELHSPKVFFALREKAYLEILAGKPLTPHIEAQIYDDFDAFDPDKYLMEDFHLAQPEEKPGIVSQMSDERFRSFARRIIFENFPEQMNADQIKEFRNRINDRINESEDPPWTTKQNASEQCDRLIESHEDTPEELMSLKHYIANL